LSDLIALQNGAYSDLINYYNGISKRPIGETWTSEVHSRYVAQL